MALRHAAIVGQGEDTKVFWDNGGSVNELYERHFHNWKLRNTAALFGNLSFGNENFLLESAFFAPQRDAPVIQRSRFLFDLLRCSAAITKRIHDEESKVL